MATLIHVVGICAPHAHSKRRFVMSIRFVLHDSHLKVASSVHGFNTDQKTFK